MSRLLKKQELENAINDFVASLRTELEEIDNDLTYIAIEDDEIKCRLHYSEMIEAKITLKFYDSFSVSGHDLPRFFDFIDRVKEEYNSILK
jgi:hypothetical protein